MALWAVGLPIYRPYAGLRAYWQKHPCCARRLEQHDADGGAPPMIAAAHTISFPALQCGVDAPPDPDFALPDVAITAATSAATTSATATTHVATRAFPMAFSIICATVRAYRANNYINWSVQPKCTS